MWSAAASGPLSAAHARVRLRAPDEVESETSATSSGARGASTVKQEEAPGAQLPHSSPDYIEERLENLKRRTAWSDYLDQYVDAFSDDEHDEAEPEYYARKIRRQPTRRRANPSGFFVSLTWSTLVLGLWPLLLLLYPFLRHKGHGFWPMGCSSMGHLAARSLANALFLLLGLLLLYWAICRELPELDADSVVMLLDARLAQLLDAGYACQTAMQELELPLVREQCTGPWIDVALVLAAAYLVFHCHRRWTRYALVALALFFFLDGPSRLFDATFPAPMISSIDPTYAMVDEEITIALDGQNLKPGGHIAWVSYWGCATTADVGACEKQFASEFSMGVAHVTFRSIDHFIPCYRDPPNPLKAQEYVCFPDVRIRVKDKQSIPGWSKIQQPTPAPAAAVAVGPTAASAQAPAAPVGTSERLDLVADDDTDEGVDDVKVGSASLMAERTAEGAESSTGITIDSDVQDSDATSEGELRAADTGTDEAHSIEGDNDDPHDTADTSERFGRSLSATDEQSRASNAQEELKTLSADQDDQHTPDIETVDIEPYSAASGDHQAAKLDATDAQGALHVDQEVDANDLVEVDEHVTVAEVQQTPVEEDVAAVTQFDLIEVKISTEDPSSLIAMIDDHKPLSSSPIRREPDQATTFEQTTIDDVAISGAEHEAPIQRVKEPEPREDREAGEAVSVEVEESLRTTGEQEDAVKAAVHAAPIEDLHAEEEVGAITDEDVATARPTVEPTASELVVLDGVDTGATVKKKPPEELVTAEDTRIHPHADKEEEEAGSLSVDAKDRQEREQDDADRSAQTSQRDRHRDQEREHASISSIRADRRGPQSAPPSTSRQAPTSVR